MIENIIKFLSNIFNWDKTMENQTVSTPEPVVISNPVQSTPVEAPVAPTAMPDRLTIFCSGIKSHEGWFTPGQKDWSGKIWVDGSPSYQHNSPGNFRCSPVGYLPKYGNVTCNANDFACFPSYELGWLYLTESIHYRATNHPTWTFLQFFENYAPVADGNDPIAYSNAIAKACGCTVDKTVSSYLAGV